MTETIRSSKKGFTLVEVIVVLVILAILAAILIPTLTGYIDKANEKKIIAEARSLYIAAQTELSDQYGTGKLTTAGTLDYSADNTNNALAKAVVVLSELDADSTKFIGIGWTATVEYTASAEITHLHYVSGNYIADYYSDASTTSGSTHAKGWTISKK